MEASPSRISDKRILRAAKEKKNTHHKIPCFKELSWAEETASTRSVKRATIERLPFGNGLRALGAVGPTRTQTLQNLSYHSDQHQPDRQSKVDFFHIFSCNNALRALRYQHFCCSRVELNAAHLRMYGAQCADRLGCVLCCSPHLLLPLQETWREHEWASGHPMWNKKWSPRVFHGESLKLKKAQTQNKVKWYDTVML